MLIKAALTPASPNYWNSSRRKGWYWQWLPTNINRLPWNWFHIISPTYVLPPSSDNGKGSTWSPTQQWCMTFWTSPGYPVKTCYMWESHLGIPSPHRTGRVSSGTYRRQCYGHCRYRRSLRRHSLPPSYPRVHIYIMIFFRRGLREKHGVFLCLSVKSTYFHA